VNLPAIQYYFGSKEGLYRAVIEHIVQHKEAHMAPLAPKVRAALADPDAPSETLLDLLCEMLEKFVALVAGGEQNEARRLFYARAEIEQTAGLDLLHKNGMRLIFEPCLALVARLLGTSADDSKTLLRTLALMGQVTMFCNHCVRQTLQLGDLQDERVREIQALVRSHTRAILRDAMTTHHPAAFGQADQKP
jgi:AcrR family transcriptional regulator